MKILITGLCLSRNLGGPAMGLTLIKELDKRLGEKNDYTFAVSSVDFKAEQEWANRYGLKAAPRAELEAYITHFTLWRYIVRLFQGKDFKYLSNAFRFWQETWSNHTKAIKESDIVINMEGVSYIGDGVRNYWEGINSFSGFLLAKLYGKPYARFIQSFGPLSRWDVRFFAKIEFKNLPFIPARGKKSAKDCLEILGASNRVYDFPDSAILLEKSPKERAESYLQKKSLPYKGFVILSPSSVVYNIKEGQNTVSGEQYIEYFEKVARYFLQRGEKILFLPHMYSEKKSECDREIARKICSKLQDVLLVEEDLTPQEAKGIIEASKFALVSRYHALVAALSTQTPVIALGWNIKYHDLMEYYDLEDFALDCRDRDVNELLKETIEKIEHYKKIDFEKLHGEAKKRVEFAFDLLARWIDESRKH